MYPYQRPQVELLLDLIKEANPGIIYPFTADNINVGTPVAQAVPSGGIADTNVMITPKHNSTYFGPVRVQYRRINLNNFFRGMTPVTVPFYSRTTTATFADFISNLNRLYGTSLLTSDFNSATVFTNGVSTNRTTTNTLCYTPNNAVPLMWRNIPPTLLEVNAEQLNGRLYPGGNDFSVVRKVQGEYLVYSIDYTGSGLPITGNATIANNTIGQLLISLLKPYRSDITFVSGPGNIAGLNYTVYTLPNASIPEANSEKYKYALAITALPTTSWLQGKILMHYN